MVTVLKYVFRSAARTEKANKLCIRSRGPPSLEPFRDRMLKLVTDLAALCEEEHTIGHTQPQSTAGSFFLPFRTGNLDRNAVSEELRAKILSPLAVSEVQGQGMGYVYILRSKLDVDALSVLKIGFSKYHPEHRAHELASCLSGPEVVAHTPLMPHAKRIESLIHTELVANRKVRACGQCGSDHREWFTISHADSREVVIRWSRWVFGQPYIDGKLSEKWQKHLQSQDFTSASPKTTISELWQDILEGFLRCKTDPAPEDQLAAYLNACYWGDIAERVMGPAKGTFTRLQNTLRDRETGMPLEIVDFSRELEKLISSNFTTDTNCNVLDTVLDDLDSRYDPDTSTSQNRIGEREFEAWKEKLREYADKIKNLKTGAFSVSDPKLGVTESPLGDATLLPVLSLKVVQNLDAPARNWIGYSPTHQGFQMLQEAYQRGEWVGNVPQFKLPKAFRKAGLTKLPTQDSAADTKGADKTTPTNSSKSKPGRNSKNAEAGRSKIEYSSGPDGDRFTFSRVFDDNTIKQMKEVQEMLKFPLGRALVEKEVIRQFRHLGIHVDGSYEAISSSEDSENDASDDDDDDDVDEMDIDEPAPNRAEVSAALR